MVYQEHAPHPGLKKHIKCYWTLAMDATLPLTGGLRFLTEGLEMAFNLADPVELEPHATPTASAQWNYTCGPLTRPMRMRPLGRVKVFGVCFRPGGAHPFFARQAGELANGYTDLANLLGSTDAGVVRTIEDRRKTNPERMSLLNDFFLDRLGNPCNADDAVAAAVDVMTSLQGRVKIGWLARRVGLSPRQLERSFKSRVGMSPKQLSRGLRFKLAFMRLARTSGGNPSSTAAACGYYDQSHMIRDFKHYTGASPAAFFATSLDREPFFTANF